MGFEPAILRPKDIDSTNASPRPTIYNMYVRTFEHVLKSVLLHMVYIHTREYMNIHHRRRLWGSGRSMHSQIIEETQSSNIQRSISWNIKNFFRKTYKELKYFKIFHIENKDFSYLYILFYLHVFKTSIWNKFIWKENAPVSYVHVLHYTGSSHAVNSFRWVSRLYVPSPSILDTLKPIIFMHAYALPIHRCRYTYIQA